MRTFAMEPVIAAFDFLGDYMGLEEMCSGNINDSFRLDFRTANDGVSRYTLQRINHHVFQNPVGVMDNIERVTAHLKASLEKDGLSPDRRVLQPVKTKAGALLHVDDEGNYWRAFLFVDSTTAYDHVEKNDQFYEAGRAFGEFQRRLYDFPVYSLHDTIADFHHTAKRFERFERAVKADACGRVRQAAKEVDFFIGHKALASAVVERVERGELPLRVTHNDTKINNVLIDNQTGKAICVIDLDTVMPGTSLYDYGDAIRYGASTAAEDEADTSKIHLDLDRFLAFTQGFLLEVKGFLPPEELKLLPLGVQVIAYELAMRFMTDYLEGDHYFKIAHPEHNLQRARAQIRLLEDVMAKAEAMQQAIEQLLLAKS